MPSAVRAALAVEGAPGATEPVHDHRWPSGMYFQQPQPITYITYKLIDGKPVEAERFHAPSPSEASLKACMP
jgi:hypothetical protein